MSFQKRRLDNGWSQEQLAMHSGLSVRTIQRIENGKPASLETLKCLAAVFETSVSTLVQEQTMTNTNTQNDHKLLDTEREAIEYVKNLKAFHLNWITFLVIIPVLYFVNLQVSPDRLWIYTVGAAWGMAIVLHAIVIYGLFSVFGGEWEQRQFLKRMRAQDMRANDK